MRHFTIGSCVLILAGLAIVTQTVADEAINQTFPYTAYVLENGAYVRSGPGNAYYSTERLKAGDAVEVYRHDPGGWLAIRPTKNSFTWIRSRYLKPLGDGLAEVIGSKVAARMGSHLDDSKDVIQVQLHKGETVELIDPQSMDAVELEPWIKIRPPSGEFRWIHSSLVDLESTNSGLRRTRGNSTPITPRTSRYENLPNGNSPMHFAHDQRPPSDYRQPVQNSASPTETGWNFEEALAELELELSQIVAADPETWSFNRIAMDAESLAGYSQTAIQRGRIREVLSKIERFEEIQERKERLNQMIAQHERQSQRLTMQNSGMRLASTNPPYATSRETIPLTSQVTITPLDNRFDGTGILRRVQPVSQGAPNYALLDDEGRILSYVTPAPDVSLDYYENRRIGVTGNRGYMPNQRKHHVMAKHVQLLR